MTDSPMTLVRQLTIAIASGKGGTGKTMVATGLAALAAKSGSRVTLVDCDAEAPNDHLFLPPDSPVSCPVFVPVAEVDADICTGCGICRETCAYGAARLLGRSVMIFEELCHGCGLCVRACPETAIHEVPQRIGEVATGFAQGFEALRLVSGQLDVGQVKTPAVIREVRRQGEAAHADLTIIDSPPGVACSAVASVRGADVMVLVTEPTPFGVHDLALALRLGAGLGLPMGIVINRDMGSSEKVEGLSATWNAPILAKIPFDRAIAETYARGGSPALELPSVGEALSRVLACLPDLAVEAQPDETGEWS
jgi:MinD superfamily P-loop ATPase